MSEELEGKRGWDWEADLDRGGCGGGRGKLTLFLRLNGLFKKDKHPTQVVSSSVDSEGCEIARNTERTRKQRTMLMLATKGDNATVCWK